MTPSFPSPGELLPHRPPMLMLQTVVSHDASHTECAGRVDPQFAEVCGTEISAAFALEFIAQAAAVHHGLCQRENGGIHTTATRGLLLGSRRLQLPARVIRIGETLRVMIAADGQGAGPGGMMRFEGEVTDAAGRTVASGDATVLEWQADALAT